MKRILGLAVLAVLQTLPAPLRAQPPGGGTITGLVTEKSTRAPIENANVLLRSRADSTRIVGTTTAKDGGFAFARVPFGAYIVECGLIGHTSFRSPVFVLDAANPQVSLHTIALKSSALVLDEVVVSTERSLFNHSVDRRVYNVEHDVMAKSSSVSDLLQNIPSVQVDIDGNVSLRGSTDVLVMVNGKKSLLMGANRADVLQQLPAANVEKIEVITNPSARFTPEGSSGIINIVTRKDALAGVNGDVTGHLGTAGRTNENVSLGCHPGRFDLFANYSHRDDQRHRFGTDERMLSGAGSTQGYREDNLVTMLPRVDMGTLGLSWHPDPRNTLDLSGEVFRRRPTREEISTIVSRDGGGAVLSDHDRRQTGYELETETGLTGAFEHDFTKEDHTLRIEANLSGEPQTEAAHFLDQWRTPAQPDAASDIVLRQTDRMGHVSLDYTDPVDERSKVEAGYALDLERQDIRSDADSLDLFQGAYVADPSRTYRFRLDQAIHAIYGTYERSFGRFGVLGGLRAEYTKLSAPIVTGALPFGDSYSGLYPTLHLSYPATKGGEVRASYSRRIRRPERDDLNPFPEYTDPFNIDSGNPRLKPETIHSYELGYRLRGDHFTFSPTLYFRDRRDGFTRLTQAINDSTFLRTMVNLVSERSAGFEPVFTISLGRMVQTNVNGNVFYDQIDASNLGYAGTRSVVSWSGTFTVTATPRAATLLEANANYRSARLTPQGDSRPSFVLNVGTKQNLWHEKLSLTLAVSDVLETQRQETRLDVAGIRQRVTSRRDSQLVYAGLTYHYGRAEKKDARDKPIQYEDQP